MDSLKIWVIEVGWKKVAPSLIRGALAALVGLIAAHHGLLSSIGIDYDPKDHTIDLNLDTLGAYLLVIGTGALTGIMTLFQHHTEAVITGQPQDGAHQRATDTQKP